MKKRIPLTAWLGSIAGAAVAVGAQYVEAGFYQQSMMLGGAIVLLLAAILGRLKMFVILQTILVVSGILGFMYFIPVEYKYMLLTLPIGIALGHLFTAKYFKKDVWAFAGIAGFLALSLAFAMSAVYTAWTFNLLMAIGGLLISLYAAVQFFYKKSWLSVVWLILNVIYLVSPVMYLWANK